MVRVVPMPGQPFDGDHQIDIKESDIWVTVVAGIKKSMAESIVRDATNRVICG